MKQSTKQNKIFAYLCRSTISLLKLSSSLIAEKSAAVLNPSAFCNVNKKIWFLPDQYPEQEDQVIMMQTAQMAPNPWQGGEGHLL